MLFLACRRREWVFHGIPSATRDRRRNVHRADLKKLHGYEVIGSDLSHYGA